MAADKIVLTFTKDKDTKNTVRFAEQVKPGEPPIVGSLYVAKGTANGTEQFTVTLEAK